MRSEVTVLPTQGAGRTRIFAWVSGGADEPVWKEPPHGSVVELGNDGAILRAFRKKAPLTSLIAAEFDHLKSGVLLMADNEAFVYQLGPGLDVKTKRQVVAGQLRPGTFDMKCLTILSVGVLSPTRGVEVAVRSCFARQETAKNPGDPASPPDDRWYERLEIVLLSEKLEVSARCQIAQEVGDPFIWNVIAADMDGDGYDEIVSLSDKVTILKRNVSR